jgi:acetolactate synthase-1/3 small subunit
MGHFSRWKRRDSPAAIGRAKLLPSRFAAHLFGLAGAAPSQTPNDWLYDNPGRLAKRGGFPVAPLAGRRNPRYHASFAYSRRITMRHVLSALVQNIPGVLAHISGMLASRGYNIDSLAVGETEDPNLSRMTFVVVGDDRILEQVRKQLEKIVTVVKVVDISAQDYVERDLMLLKVKAPSGAKRSEIRELTDIFRGRIVDVGVEEVMIEISGQERKIESFIDLMRPYGIKELVRSGRIAMVRSRQRTGDASATT